jgi:hypothetical protein
MKQDETGALFAMITKLSTFGMRILYCSLHTNQPRATLSIYTVHNCNYPNWIVDLAWAMPLNVQILPVGGVWVAAQVQGCSGCVGCFCTLPCVSRGLFCRLRRNRNIATCLSDLDSEECLARELNDVRALTEI